MINPSFSLYFCHFVVSLLYLFICKRVCLVLSLLLFHFISSSLIKSQSLIRRSIDMGWVLYSCAVERCTSTVFMRYLVLLPWGIRNLPQAICGGLRILHLHLSVVQLHHFLCSPLKSFCATASFFHPPLLPFPLFPPAPSSFGPRDANKMWSVLMRWGYVI